MQSQHETSPTARIFSVYCVVAFMLFVGADLISQPVFMDGAIYGSIARNLQDGFGSAWSPYFSETLFPVFAEHPPFMFWIQSVFIVIVGDGILQDRAFSLVLLTANVVLFFQLWRLLVQPYSWLAATFSLPLFLYLVSGRVGWGFANNMLENMVSVLTLAAVVLLITAYQTPRKTWLRVALVVAAALATFLAVLTKGPVGLFPLAAGAIYWLVFRRPAFLTVVADAILMVLVVVGGVFLLLQFAEPAGNIQRYLDQQLIASLSGDRGGRGGHLKGLYTLFVMVLPALAVAVGAFAIAFILGRWATMEKVSRPSSDTMKIAVFLILVGLSASLPICISPRVTRFYFNPALCYFAAAAAVMCAPYVIVITNWCLARARALVYLGIGVLFAGSITFAVSSADKHTDVSDSQRIAETICPSSAICRETILTCPNNWTNWELHAVLQRQHGISLGHIDRHFDDQAHYLESPDCQIPPPSDFEPLSIELAGYTLYLRPADSAE